MTNEDWKRIRPVRSYEQVMTQIEQRILDGRIRAGDKLPNERDLASLLAVSRPSLREALRVLEAMGIVEIRTGTGAHGGTLVAREPGSGFTNLLKFQLALAQFGRKEALDTDIALEAWSCEEAATRANKQDHRELSLLLEKMDHPDLSALEFDRLDAHFHVRIAISAGNSLSAHLVGSLKAAIGQRLIEPHLSLDNWKESAKAIRRDHREILDAVRAGRPSEARRAMRDHLRNFPNQLLSQHPESNGLHTVVEVPAPAIRPRPPQPSTGRTR